MFLVRCVLAPAQENQEPARNFIAHIAHSHSTTTQAQHTQYCHLLKLFFPIILMNK